MSLQITKLIDAGQALSLVIQSDIYSGALGFFQLMGYPIDQQRQNVSMGGSRFIYLHSEMPVHFTHKDIVNIAPAVNVARLFSISNQCTGFDAMHRGHLNGVVVRSIVFLAVELGDDVGSRSYNAHNISQILSKCYSSPVVILFRQNGTILLTAVHYASGIASGLIDVFMSDWYCSSEQSVGELVRLSDIAMENLDVQDFASMFCDLAWLLSREYYIISESHEYKRYGLLSHEFLAEGWPYSREDIVELVQHKGRYYEDKYGDDYVVHGDQTEMLFFNDHEWTMADLEGDSSNVTENYDDTEEGLEEDEQSQAEDHDDLMNIDQSILSDPIKLLQFIEGKHRP